MSLPIDPAKALDLTGKIASAVVSTSKSLLPINIDINYSKVVSVTRIETDTFQICHAKAVKSKKYLVFEKTTIVHQKNKDEFNLIPL